MAHIYADRVRETTTSTGTASFTLDGAVQGYQAFSAALATNDTCEYYASRGTQWEVGIGTLTSSNVLTRTQVLASSNSNSAVNFAAGTKDVALTASARRNTHALLRLARGHIAGLTLANQLLGTPSGTFTVEFGQAGADVAPYTLMELAITWTKTSAAFAVGSLNGSLDTGSLANNTWYHVWLIGKLDGTTDILTSLSPATPTMPTGFVLKRRIGALKTRSDGNWTEFVQRKDRFQWRTPVVEVNDTNSGTGGAYAAVNVPPDIGGMIAHLTCSGYHATLAHWHSVYSPYQADPTNSFQHTLHNDPAFSAYGQHDVLTNEASQVRYLSAQNTSTVTVCTLGWTDHRGRG
jgi:hypothetical protein